MDNIDHSNFKRRVIYNKIPSKKMTAAYDYRVLPDFLLNVKVMFSKKAKKIDKIFTVDLMVTTYCQIDGEDFVNLFGLLWKRELYQKNTKKTPFSKIDIK